MRKKFLQILLAMALLCISVGLLVACEKPHEHSFPANYKASDFFHWQECECGVKINEGMHAGGEATCTQKAVCEVCSAEYGELKAHEYNIPVVTDQTHYSQCSCGKTTTANEHDYVDGACVCGYKKPVQPHTHQCDTLRFDQFSHWHVCSCGVTANGANHTGRKADCENKAKCDVCMQVYGDYGHAWNNGELTKEPTQDKDGTITYTCSICRENKEETATKGQKIYTRADLEKAVVEVGWAYYAKGKAVQYDSSILTNLSGTYGGIVRHSQEVSPEYGTSDKTIFSVCTAFTSATYLKGIGRRILEGRFNPNATTTAELWYMSENQIEEGYYPDSTNAPDPITENDKDIAILRWVDYDKYATSVSAELPRAKKFGVFEASSFYDWYDDGTLELREENGKYAYYLNNQKISNSKAKDLCFDYLLKMENDQFVNMRLGDVLVYDGHALLYIGNGRVLDCNGAKYDTNTGKDKVEGNGAIAGRMLTLASTLERAKTDFILIRPLDFYGADYDDNPDNDIMVYNGERIEVQKETLTREKYPAMDIDRTIDKTPYGTIAQGENVTYKVKITNKTTESRYKLWKGNGYSGQDYNDLIVTEKIPQGTTFVSASMDKTPIDGTITWEVNIPAGESVELLYTVNVTAPIGSVIVSDGGFVENIPSNVIKNRVGGQKLNEEQKVLLSSLANSDVNTWSTTYGKDMDFAEGVYKAIGVEITLPSVKDLVENLFKPARLEKRISFNRINENNNSPLVMYMPQNTVNEFYQQAKNMLIDGYYGGYRMYDMDLDKVAEMGVFNVDVSEEMNKSIIDFRTEFLEVGDILVFGTAKDRTDTGMTSELSSFEIAIYVGNETLIQMSSSGTGAIYSGKGAEEVLVKSMIKTTDIFFALRPSQANVI